MWPFSRRPVETTVVAKKVVEKPVVRTWGCNEDGSKYETGLTVAELIAHLQSYKDQNAEVCVVIAPWNGILGKVKSVEQGTDSWKEHQGQVWLKANVLDESLNPTHG